MVVRARERARGSFLYAIRGGGREQGSPAMVTAAQCLVGEIRGLRIDVEVHGLRLASNLGWIVRAGWFRQNGAAWARGGRGRALCLPGHDDGAAVCAGMHEATRRAREHWAVQNSVASRCWLHWLPRVALPPQKLPASAMSQPPTPASVQEGVRCFGQGEGAVHNALGRTGDR